jgi:hypothetical protein
MRRIPGDARDRSHGDAGVPKTRPQPPNRMSRESSSARRISGRYRWTRPWPAPARGRAGLSRRGRTSADSSSSGCWGSRWPGNPSLAEAYFGFSGRIGRPKCPRRPLVPAPAERKSRAEHRLHHRKYRFCSVLRTWKPLGQVEAHEVIRDRVVWTRHWLPGCVIRIPAILCARFGSQIRDFRFPISRPSARNPWTPYVSCSVKGGGLGGGNPW